MTKNMEESSNPAMRPDVNTQHEEGERTAAVAFFMARASVGAAVRVDTVCSGE